MNFSALPSVDLPGIGARLDRFVHPSGLRHFHLNNSAVAPSFMICFPTPPVGDDGRPHVLEHLVLSGSQAYPVRKVFWRANERSLASFMNAMTDDVATYFPFVTPHVDDYRMLLGVYLDSALRPTLDRADFMEEGFRVEQNEAGEAVFQGVVFNEMISAFEDPDRHLLSALERQFYPHSALGFESGGDPLSITSLTHEKIVAFHRQCYHPANAVIFTAGPDAVIDVTHTGVIQTLGLLNPAPTPPVPTMPTHELHERRRADLGLPSETQDHQLVMAWPLGSVTEGVPVWLQAQLAEAIWFDESSPFSLAQQAAELGRMGSLRGVHTFGNDQWLILHFQGLDAGQLETVEALVRQTLAQTAIDGLPTEQLERFRRDVDIQLRRTTDLGPEGALDRFFHAVKPVLYSRTEQPDELVSLLDIQGFQAQWRDAMVQPQSVKDLALSLQNQTSELVLHVWPDSQFHVRRAQAMDAQLAQATERLREPAGQAQVIEDARCLALRQSDTISADVLPSFPVQRIPVRLPMVPHVEEVEQGLLLAPADSEGLVSLALVADMSQLSAAVSRDMIALMGVFMPGLGETGLSWQEASVIRQKAGVDIVGQMSAGMTGAGGMSAMGQVRGLTRLEDAPALARVLGQMVARVNLTDADRLAYLILSERDANQDSLISGGSEWAQTRLAAGIHRRGELDHALDGLPSVVFWQDLVHRFEKDTKAAMAAIQQRLVQLRALNWRVVVTGDRRGIDAGQQLRDQVRDMGWALRTSAQPNVAPFITTEQHIALISPQRTGGHHGAAWLAPTDLGADSAGLMLLGQLLTQEEIWPRLREKGGAYGGGARWERGMFKMSSWRDPRVAGTFQDFDESRLRALTCFSPQQIEHAKRLVFQIQDRPLPPLARARQAVEHFWRGDQAADLQCLRENLLSANGASIRQAAQTWLAQPAHSRVAFTDDQHRLEAQAIGLAGENLPIADED